MGQGSINDDDGHQLLLKKPGKAHKKDTGTAKAVAFVVIGGLTLLYCIAELAAAIYLNSLVLLSDGFHNLSDVVSLYIAYWAQTAAQRDLSKDMSYGWARTEILGGLTNGCFLLSLCLYVALEAIPRLIKPESTEALGKEDGSYLYIGIAAVGLALNIIGTIVFGIVGVSHGHSHSHGHGHGHGHKDPTPVGVTAVNDHDHDHDHEHDHDHDHKEKEKSHKHAEGEVKKKKKDHSHAHAHGDEHKHKDKKDKKKDKHKHEKAEMDMNTKAVFLHFLGDAISSLCVLATGLILHFFTKVHFIIYLDPIASLLIIIIILVTTVPLVKRCSMILLQSVPSNVDLDAVTARTSMVAGVVSVHDLHVWQLVDGMIIASVHLMIAEGTDVGNVVYQAKQIFHAFGIHSSAIQPEFIKSATQDKYCLQNCVEDCEEDWCCKKTADKGKGEMDVEYSTFGKNGSHV